MTIQDIYKLSISLGIKNDFRGKKEIQEYLKRKKDKYKELPKEKKEFFDKDNLFNPYSDSRVYVDNGVKKVKKILAALDVDGSDLLMFKYLNDQNPKNKFDLVINHHMFGRALLDLSDTMHLQADVLSLYGIPINVAESLLKVRVDEVYRKITPSNAYKEIDTAKMLGVNFMNVHTPADNMVARFVERKITKDKPKYVDDILKSLLQIPEYKKASKMGFGPMLFAGKPENRCGKIAFSEITGGTEGSPKIYQAMANAGIGTIIAMHQSEDHRKAAEKAHINVVIAGHISSDSLGMNLFLDELEKKGIEIVPTGGLIRVSRNKK